MKLKCVGIALLGCALAVPAHAGFNAGLMQNFGTDEYRGTNVYAAISGGGFSFSPEYRRYELDGSSGPYQNISGRIGYDMRYFGLGVSAGVTPNKSGYQSASGGADFAFTLAPTGDKHIRRIGGSGRGGAPVGKGVARVDFGGGVTLTQHKQDVSGIYASSKLNQTEVHGFVGASVLKTLLSVRAAKYSYDKDLRNATNAPPPRWNVVNGHSSYTSPYPDGSVHFLAEAPVFPMVAPWASYTYSRYEELPLAVGGRPGDSRALSFGVNVGLEMVAVHASYQHVNVTGGDDQNYAGLSASLRL